MAHEEHRKTQNSTIKTAGDHNDVTIDYSRRIRDIIELSYTKNSKGDRYVILLRCEWFNLEGRTYQMVTSRALTSKANGIRMILSF
jgi:hypothetical protein